MVLNLKQNIIFVDVSYLIFYRFFALKKWFKFAHKDVNTSSSNYKWLENKVYIEKFEKTLLDTVKIIAKKRKVPLNNIIFGIDCHFKNNWRLKYCKTTSSEDYMIYKGDRKEDLKKQGFHEYEIFDLVEKDYLSNFAKEHHNIILEHKNAEADDCIALGIRELIQKKKFKKEIWIIASDFDYLQLCNQQIHLIDLKKNQLDIKHLKDKGLTNQEYLIKKIMIGDKSDNIKPCNIKLDLISDINQKCGIKLRKNKKGVYSITETTFKHIWGCLELRTNIIDYFLKNKDILINNKKQKEDAISLIQTIFDMNQRLIDFDLIPRHIKIKL